MAPAEVSAELLRHLVRRAEAHLGKAVDGAVVAVPAHFDGPQRAATAEAGRLAGLASVQLLQGARPARPPPARRAGRPHSEPWRTGRVARLQGGAASASGLFTNSTRRSRVRSPVLRGTGWHRPGSGCDRVPRCPSREAGARLQSRWRPRWRTAWAARPTRRSSWCSIWAAARSTAAWSRRSRAAWRRGAGPRPARFAYWPGPDERGPPKGQRRGLPGGNGSPHAVLLSAGSAPCLHPATPLRNSSERRSVCGIPYPTLPHPPICAT